MKYPEGYLWEYPGFPSITVSYLKTNDFFFSGHVGLPILLGLEFKYIKHYYMFLFCLFTCAFEAFTMIAMRGHYSIDIIAGVIFAHYTYILVSQYIQYLDDSCVSMQSSKGLGNEGERNSKNSLDEKFIPVEVKA
jgi:hypothetical protein